MDNLVYISGPHGSGKSTLKQLLEKQAPDILSYNRLEHMIKLDDPFERQLLRITKYRLDFERQKNMANSNPDKLILCDRCIHDGIVYTLSFMEIGWLSVEHTALIIVQVLNAMFGAKDMPRNVILLQPTTEVTQQWIRKRQEVEGGKWRENDFSYLDIISECYKLYFKSIKVENLLIVTETDQQKRLELCMEFISKIRR